MCTVPGPARTLRAGPPAAPLQSAAPPLPTAKRASQTSPPRPPGGCGRRVCRHAGTSAGRASGLPGRLPGPPWGRARSARGKPSACGVEGGVGGGVGSQRLQAAADGALEQRARRTGRCPLRQGGRAALGPGWRGTGLRPDGPGRAPLPDSSHSRSRTESAACAGPRLALPTARRRCPADLG